MENFTKSILQLIELKIKELQLDNLEHKSQYILGKDIAYNQCIKIIKELQLEVKKLEKEQEELRNLPIEQIIIKLEELEKESRNHLSA